jgi:hypothetical protein
MKISKSIFALLFITCLLSNNIILCTKTETAAGFRSAFSMFMQKKNQNKDEPETKVNFGGNVSSDEYQSNLANMMNKNVPDEETKVDFQDLKKQDLPDRQVYFQGWVKYFRYLEDGKEKPQNFFKNPQFQKQDPSIAQSAGADENGPMLIPTEKHFWGIIYQNYMNFLESRDNPLMNTIDSLSVDLIKTIPEDNNYAGGIKDFGKFPEGSCFEARTVRPAETFKMTQETTEPANGANETWLICADDDAKKREMMNLIINLKLKKQHEVGAYVHTPADPKFKNKLNQQVTKQTMGGLLTGKEAGTDFKDPNAKAEDGYWVVLNNWTVCTLKCGGGLRYLQLQCMPPRNGGKACKGEAIRTQPCNEQPCPGVDALKNVFLPDGKPKDPLAEKMSKPVVKMMPISSRPQRYDKCNIKDGDALMLKNDKETASFDVAPRVPVRLVMNNKSVTVYQDETLSTNLGTFMLGSTTFGRVKDDPKCFILVGLQTKMQFCQLDSSNGANFVEEWDYDFNLFKFQCKQPREKVEFENEEQIFQSKLGKIQGDLAMQKAQVVKQKEEQKEETKLQKVVENAEKMTLMAVEKELRMEDLLEKEEMQKEKLEQQKLREMITAEKNKEECMQKNIREKELEDEFNMKKAEAQEEVQKIKEDAKRQITAKRQQVKARLDLLRKNSQREAEKLRAELQSIRSKTANNMQKYTKQGSAAKCFNPEKKIEIPLDELNQKMEEYCQVHYANESGKYNECRNSQNFCYVCCETEFGDLHIPQREACYKDVCDEIKETKKDSEFISSMLNPDKNVASQALHTN